MKTDTTKANGWLVFPKPNPQASLRLFCLPFAGGGAQTFAAWPDGLSDSVEVCAIQLPGREARSAEPPLTDLASVLDALTPALVPHLDKPFVLFGHGVGAIIAFELARKLSREHKLLPECLVVSARVAPHLPVTPGSGVSRAESLAPEHQADLAIHENYTYTADAPLDCDLVVFGGLQDSETSKESLEAWQQHAARKFVRRLFPGDHRFIATGRTPFLRIFAQQLYPIAEKARLQPKKKISSLQSKIVSAEDKAAMPDWFYLPIWKQAEAVSTVRRQDRLWVIFADEGGLGQGIAERARAKGLEAVLVRSASAYAKRNDDEFVVRIGEQGDYSRLLKELRKAGRIPTRIVHLWTADREWEGTLAQKLDRSFYSLFYLAQAIGDQLTMDEIELVTISSDMQEVTGEEVLQPEKATVRGPCKVIRQEYPHVATRSIDISFGESEAPHRESLIDWLAAELQINTREQFVAFRHGKRWTEQFENLRMEAPAEQSPRFRDAGVYLITGGLGGIGLAFAEFMFAAVKAKLVLVGRSALPPKEQWASVLAQANADTMLKDKIAQIQALEAAGADVLMIAADVSRADQMENVVRQAVARFGTINGVFHAAGVPGQGLTQLKSAATAAGVLAPKVQGTLALEAALAGIQLDFFVLVSSIASFTGGGPGQIDYCAGNAFLDAYARRNVRKNGITVSINFGEWQWDAWSAGLLGYPPEVREAFIANRRKFGIGLQEGMEAIRRVLSADLAQMIMVPQNFHPMVQGSNDCIAAKLTDEVSKTRKQQQKSYPRPALGTSFVPVGSELERKIAEIWQRVLGIESIGVQDNFFELGGNSLVGLQVIADMKRELDVEIAPVALYEAPTVSAFARYLQPETHEQQSAAADALMTRRTQVRQTRSSREIAIVGMAGRFPGARSPRELWRNVSAGVESIRFYSDAELIASGVDRAELRNPNYIKAGGDLDDIDLFDAMLFGYAPREAETIDPQHRFFLECAWEALEDAGYDPDRYPGLIGVFGGANSSRYHSFITSRPDLLTDGVAIWMAGVGNTNDSLATRVSYKLNLRGPSLSVQTFCSTSGVATHLACQSLLAGECDIALAGGVNIAIPNKTGYVYEEGGIISPDGHTRTFDAHSKGAVISDGVAIVVLKRLEEALADGDQIYAVIKGSAINNDGSVKVGYTAPSVEGQAAAILDALSVAGVEAETIEYVEAHGTATELGDPIEVTALSRAYGQNSEKQQFCAIGSVKTNIGHLDRAAGVTALIKTALSLRNEFLPPLLHFEAPNPNIDFARSPFYVCAQPKVWKKNGAPRRAAVNVVGLGGTNVHLVLEEAPAAATAPSPSRKSQLLLLSAKTSTALDAATANLSAWLRDPANAGLNLADVAYTLQVGRRGLEHRRAVVCNSVEDALAALEANDGQRVLSGYQQPRKKSLVFMFAGVGDHYADMGAELYEAEEEFRAQVDRCCEVLQPLLGVDLRTVMFDKPGSDKPASDKTSGERRKDAVDLRAMVSPGGPGVEKVHHTHLAQPAVFVIEYSLARLLMSWGLVPAALIGYSLGEYVAATIAGTLSLADALKLVAGRARLIDKLPHGAMLAVALSEEELAPLVADADANGISIAVCNGPKLTVVAGPEEAIAALQATLTRKEIACRRLPTTHAFHSRMMEPACDEFARLIKSVELKEPSIPYISNVSGKWITPEEAADAQYWTRHMCQTVRFSAGVEELLKDGDRVFVEFGAGQSLAALVKQHPKYRGEDGQVIVPTLSAAYQRQPELELLLRSLGRLWLAGVQPEWTGFYGQERRQRVSLPTYAFDRQRFWVEPADSKRIGSGAVARATGKNADIAEWFYKPIWRDSRLPARAGRPAMSCSVGVSAPATVTRSRWLLFANEDRSIGSRLEAAGQQVVWVTAGDRFERRSDSEYEIRAAEAQDYDRLIQELREGGKLPEKIGHLWSAAESGADDFARWQELGYYSLLHIVQAVGRQMVLDPLEVVVVSSHMQAVTDEDTVCAGKATLLGPCKGIPQENPQIVCRSVDIDADLGEGLVDELLSNSGDPVVAYRQSKRLVQDFEPLRMEALAEGQTRLRHQGVYVITGGLGGVGLILARHLAERVQARLVLVGRSGLPERELWQEWLDAHEEDDATSQKIEKVRALEELGAKVLIAAADAGDERQMAGVIHKACEEFGALHGVVHAAGISEGWAFHVVQEVGRADSEYHFQPKAYGLMALEKALEGRELDFCLLTSSLSSILGGMKLTAYAAANSFMDAFTHNHNRKAGVRWQAINWDTWRLKANQHGALGKTVAEFEMSPEEGCEAFERLIFHNPASQVVESTGDLNARLDQWVRRQFLTAAPAGAGAAPAKGTLYARPNLPTAYVPASNDLEERIANIWQQVLGIENVGSHDNYFDLGGTSLSAIQVISQLQKELGVPVSPILLFEAPTIAELAKVLRPSASSSSDQKALALQQITARKQKLKERSGSAEIAIIGMTGRFPGANGVDQLWRNLLNRVEALTWFSDNELLESGVEPAELRRPNYVKARPILEDVDLFDASFFGYSPRDAELMDPQHRLLMETAWEALEIAGYDSLRYDGSIGMFAGTNISGYLLGLYSDPERPPLNMFEACLGNDKDSLTTKISYKLNLKGPSFAVQTFCSSSLVAVHLACQSLRMGECDMALAGGVALRLPTKIGYVYEPGDQDSPDGHTRTFDANAKGTTFGDGVALVVLKRLDDALADGDTIHAVIKGTAINNDGAAKIGYTAPSVDSQAEVVALALADAGVTAGDISYVEAHGTATELGDPIEVAALTKAFRATTSAKNYCALGTVKTNIGHLDRASGVTGLIKTVASLKAGLIPGILHFESPNPKIDFDNSPFFVNTDTRAWPRNGAPRRAGVTSLGVGGTNAHVVVEEAPIVESPDSASLSASARPWQVLTLSAKTEAALEAMTANLAHHLESVRDVGLADVAYTLQTGRRQFSYRRPVVCQDAAGAVRALESGAPITREARSKPIVFLFPGLGDHYVGMGAGLYEHEPSFRADVDQCCTLLREHIGVDLRQIMFSGDAKGQDLSALFFRGVKNQDEKADRLNQTWLAQPAVFVIEYALARLLMSWGIVPQALIGSSVGEFAAATIAGRLSLADALRLVAGRARLIDKLPSGAMLAVPLPERGVAAIAAAGAGAEAGISIAIAAGPRLTIVAGPEDAIVKFELTLKEREVVSRRLQTTHAFHSTMMDAARDELSKLLKTVTLDEPRIPCISNVSGTWITPDEAADAEYWTRHMCQTVRFGDGIAEILRGGDKTFVEIGPGEGLASLVKQHLQDTSSTDSVVVPTMKSVYAREDDEEVLQRALGRLWAAAIEIDWQAYHAHERRRKVPLPTYPFERQRFWIQTTGTKRKALAAGKKSDVGDWFYEPTWAEATLARQPAGAASHWLLFVDDRGVGLELAERLRKAGHRVTTVSAGLEFARISADRYVIDPAEPSHYKVVVKGLRDSGATFDHIAHLWSVTTAEDFSELQERGFYSLLSLAKALGDNRITGAVKLDVISDGLYAASADERPNADKATLISPCRIIPQEYPNITCRSIDIESGEPNEQPDERLLNNLFAEVTSDCADVAVCYRRGRRLVEAMPAVRLDAVTEENDVLRKGGVYVITGGLGVVGIILADMMATRYAAKVVLTTRRSFPAKQDWPEWIASHGEDDGTSEKIRTLEGIEAKAGDGEVLVVTADVADEAAMRRVFDMIDERFGALNGVVHAAGLTSSQTHRVIQEIPLKDCDEHFTSKVQGTLVLERLLRDRDVDFCVLYSSISVTLGGITLAAYAAANAFQASFALGQRSRTRTRWIAVQWDTWKAERDRGIDVHEQKYKGLETTISEFVMWPNEGMEAFRRVLGSTTATHLVNSTAELQVRLDQWVYRTHLREAKGGKKSATSSHYARPNLPTAYVPVASEIEERVARVLQDVLGIDKIGLHDNYFDLGGNSLVALQVVAQLQKEFDAQLSPIAIFEAPTVAEMAKLFSPANGIQESCSIMQLVERRQRLKAAAGRNEIAIIGMAGRFPGAADISQFWENVRDGVESLTVFTDDELLESGAADPATLRNPAYVKARPIVNGIDEFDAGAFGFSPREAELMDPQHRLMLETAWQTLEHAGYDSLRYPGAIGVFAGSNLSWYLLNLHADRELWAGLNKLETNIGNDKDSLTTIISYKLNLKGPSFAVQTFCSTSGVAVHLACQSLRLGESDMALAGGVALHVPTRQGYMYEPGNQASPDGHTRAFDAGAKGTVFADGVAMVLLKRLDDALADGDTIHAVIKGSALNNDGSLKVGYTAPSVERQSEVVSLALADAGLTADDISYVESHGTATDLGDPIEVAALTKAFRTTTTARQFCALGSVKTNIGHTDRAAGVIGLIKAVHVLKTGLIPPTLFFKTPNPKLDLENSPFFVNSELRELPATGTPWRAGVTALGVGGTNAHLIVEQAPVPEPGGPGRPWQLLTLSAKTRSALDAAAVNLAEHLKRTAGIDLADVAYTLQRGRREWNERRVVVCRNAAEAIDALQASSAPKVFTSSNESRRRAIVFMFPGVGEQYVNMAAGLYDSEPVFRAEMDECCDLLQTEAGVDLRSLLFAGIDRKSSPVALAKVFFRAEPGADAAAQPLNQTATAQSAVFAVEYCLAKLLMSWGIVPQALIGYSVGEFAAAAIAGSLSLPDAVRLVAGRAKLIERLPGGGMLAVPLSEEDCAGLIGDELSIAICNGPKLTVISGPDDAIAALEARLRDREIVSRRLATTHAFHSRMMEPAYTALVDLVKSVEIREPRIPYVSNVTGEWIKKEEATDPAYWARHMCQCVRFSEGIGAVLGGAAKILVEVGPGQSLSSMVKQHPEYQRRPETVAVSTMNTAYSREEDQEVLLGTLAKLWVVGADIDWEGFYRDERRRRIPLPGYPFERQSYWLQPQRQAVSLYERISSGQDKAELADWFYVPGWKRAELPPSENEVSADKCWLIFADAHGLGDEIAEIAAKRGVQAVVVKPGDAYGKTGENSFVIRMTDKAQYRALFKELRQSARAPNRIVHLWTVSETGGEGNLDAGFYSLFYIAQAIGEQFASDAIDLCVVSSDMQPVTGEEHLCLEAAAIKGPVKVIRQEYANVSCRNLDVSWAASEAPHRDGWAGLIVSELAAASADQADQFVAFREGQRWTQYFDQIRMEAPPQQTPRFRERGVYLVTGGMGGIGLAFAEYMFQTLRARLVLVGRSALPPRAQWAELLASEGASHTLTDKIRKVMALEDAGAEVLLIAGDVADRKQMHSVVQQTLERFGEIHGVFHAAGVPGVGLTQLKAAETAASVLAPKVMGTLALDEALTASGVQLDFMILVSSVASFSGGGPGQIDYCAANAFLDAYARRNFRRHGITVAINWAEWQWDAWSEGLMGFQPEVREAFIATRKKYGIAFDEGMEAIHRILSVDIPQVIVAPQAFIPMVEGSNECTAVKLTEAVNKTRKQQQRSYPRPALATSFVAANNELEKKIADIWQKVLGIENIGIQDNFFDLGGNSLIGLQVIADLTKALDAEINPVALYEAPTVSAFARYLNPEIDREAAAADLMVASRREQVRRARISQEVAIIGMAGRFPGARNVRELWRNVSTGVESVSFYSDAELIAAGVDRAELTNPNYVRARGDVDGIDWFDAMLFGYSPREAETIDPQHRFFLECAWEALEDAGYDPERYPGLIGVFGGANYSKYYSNIKSRPDLLASGLATWQAEVGNTNDSLATRVSYKLNLKGPSLSVQTFCSTSGVAVHMACQNLLTGACDMALAGGVNISVPNRVGYMYEEGGILSRDGHTRTFDAKANGAGVGDGVGLVVLKRLEEALADGDHVYAVIKGSAINNDGSVKVGYTAPSVDGQCAAILDALSVAGVEAETISYVEAHGTATELGDPIEVTALSKAYGRDAARRQFCAIGSVKTNIGHLDRASGVTALIKTALSLQHEFLPALLHFEAPNPNIDFTNSPFYVCAQPQVWKKNGVARRAGVNVVGLGGTNAHLILEEAPSIPASGPSRTSQLLLLSAKTAPALDAATANLCAWLREHADANLADVAYTLQVGRRRLEHRRAVLCDGVDDALAALEGKSGDRVMSGYQQPRKKPIVFKFAGAGEYIGAGLYEEEEEFRAQVDRCCDLALPLVGVDLRTVLFERASAQHDTHTHLARAAVFVIEYALARLLMVWGITPQAASGEGVGQLVADVVTGTVSLQEALRLVASREQELSPASDVGHGDVLLVEVGPGLASCVNLLLDTVARLWMAGADIDWNGFHSRTTRHRVPLPTYPFERQRYWIERDNTAARAAITAAPTNGKGRPPDVSDWFYVPVWKHARQLNSNVINGNGSPWLVFADESSLSDKIVSALTAGNHDVIRVRRGETFSRDDAGGYTLAPTDRRQYARLCAELSSRGRRPGHVLHLWSLAPPHERVEIEKHGVTPLTSVAQALHDTGREHVEILVVTNGMAQVTAAETVIPEKALLIGPCQCLGAEFDGVSCRALDVVHGQDEEELAENILGEAMHGSSDALVAYRGDQRWVRTFEPVALDAVTHAKKLRKGGVYAITNGLGSIELAIADHLARTMSAKLALIDGGSLPSRESWDVLMRDGVETNDAARRVWQISAIEEMGSPVLLLNADTSDPRQMRGAVQQIVDRFGRLDGMFYSANGGGHRAFSLDEALHDVPLDFTMLISPVSAAGAYLDAYAHARSSRRRPVVSIHAPEWLSSNGHGIRFEEGVDALLRSLHAGLPEVIVCTQNPATYTHNGNGHSVQPTAAAGLRLHPRPALANRYAAPVSDVQRKMADIWQELMGIEHVGIHDSFFELGGDSLLAARIFSRMRREFPIALAVRSIFELPTIEDQAAMLSDLGWMESNLGVEFADANVIEGEI